MPIIKRQQVTHFKDQKYCKAFINHIASLSPEIIKDLNAYEAKDMKISLLRPQYKSLNWGDLNGAFTPQAFKLHPSKINWALVIILPVVRL